MFTPLIIWQWPSVSLNQVTWLHWGLLGTYALTGAALFYIFWYRGLSKTSASTAALFTGIMPISATLLAIIFLKETLSWFEIVGMALVISSIILGAGKLKAKR